VEVNKCQRKNNQLDQLLFMWKERGKNYGHETESKTEKPKSKKVVKTKKAQKAEEGMSYIFVISAAARWNVFQIAPEWSFAVSSR